MMRAVRWAIVIGAVVLATAAEGRMTPECKAALADADRAAKKGDPAAASAALDEAARLGADPPEGGECIARVFAKRAELAAAQPDHGAATKYFRQAAHRAVENAALWRTLSQARIGAEKKASRADRADRITKLLASEAAVSALDRRPAVGKGGRAAADKALAEALAAFKKDKDRVRREWVLAVQAKVLAASGDAPAARALAAPIAVDAPRRPRFVQITAHEALALAAAAEHDVEAEARAALWTDFLRAELAARPPEERRFGRSKDTDRACAHFEKKAGDGQCSALALATTGQPSFSDPSRARPKKTVSLDEIERVQRQYTPAIEACVRAAAKAHGDSELFENASLKIGWAVRADGRAGDVEVEPKRYDAAVGPCARERVGWFRYPRATDGQTHSVVLPFKLDLIEKYGGR